MNLFATISTDLRRISYWKIQGQDDLANRFLDANLQKYANLEARIGKLSFQDTLQKIKTLDERKAAELAMTASIILQNRSGL